jgi:Protein of unknown function (DUF1275)
MVNGCSSMNHGARRALHDDSAKGGVPLPSVDGSRAAKLLPFVLSVIAGNVDIIGFLGLGGLFTAHVTGNLVVLAAKVVAGDQASLAHLIAVPRVCGRAYTDPTTGRCAGADPNQFASTFAGLAVPFALGLLQRLRRSRSGYRSQHGAHDLCGHARRLRNGRAERACASLAEGSAIHGGDDDQHHPLHYGHRKDIAPGRCEWRCRGARPRWQHLAGDHRIPARLRPWCGMRDRPWPAVSYVAGYACAFRHSFGLIRCAARCWGDQFMEQRTT